MTIVMLCCNSLNCIGHVWCMELNDLRLCKINAILCMTTNERRDVMNCYVFNIVMIKQMENITDMF